jgi:hypothetical protein
MQTYRQTEQQAEQARKFFCKYLIEFISKYCSQKEQWTNMKYAYIRYVNFIGIVNRQADKRVNRRLARRKIVVIV